MRREFTGVAMLLVMLATTVGISYWVIVRLDKPKSQLQEKRESAELIRYYVITRDAGPTFALRKNDKILKFITHAELPAYDANARTLYGLGLTIRSRDGESVWSHDIYTRTRQSKDGERDGRFRYENTFGVDPREQYGDDRLLEVRLPDAVPDGSSLELRLLGADGEQVQVKRALVRAYRQVRRSDVARRYRYLSLSERQKAGMARKLSTPWGNIPEETRLAMLARRWNRMAAIGEEGIDYRTRLVFYTGFRLVAERDDEKDGVHVHALHEAAINVLIDESTDMLVQAVRFDGESRRCTPRLNRPVATDPDAGPDDQSSGSISLDIDSVSSGDGVSERISVPDNGDGVTRIVRVSPGLHTLRFRTESPVGVVFCLFADERDESQFAIDTIPLGDNLEQLVVDTRKLPAYLSGVSPDEPPIVTYVDGPPDLYTRLLMFEVRMLMTGQEWSGPAPQLHFRFYDEHRNDLGSGQTQLRPVLAPFEKVRLDHSLAQTSVDGHRPDRPSYEDEIALLRPVSEPMRFQVLAPAQTRWVEIETVEPSVIRVLGYLDDGSRYETPYRDHVPEGLIWRYGPRERRRWYPTRPENHEELANSGRIPRIRAQVRLQKSEPRVTPDGQREAVLLEPIRPRERQFILEGVPDERKSELAGKWPVGMYTLLDRPRQIAVRGRAGKRPRIRYLVDGDGRQLLGMRVQITIQGMKPIVKRLSTPRGIWNLPYLPVGAPLIECTLLAAEDKPIEDAGLRALASQLRCYIDRPPTNVNNATIVRARTVFPLDHRPLRLRVVKTPGKHLVVNAVVYSRRPSARAGQMIHAVIDRGRPRRNVGSLVSGLTRADRWWPLPERRSDDAPIFVDLAGRSPGYPRVVSIRLGDDVKAGSHDIVIAAPSLSAWVRFFTYDIDPARQESAWQWSFEAP